VHRASEISYPTKRLSSGIIRTSVLLEMGTRGGEEPHDRVLIGCLLGHALAAAGTDLAEFADLAPFELKVLHPGRTLLEKLAIISGLSQKLIADPSAQIRDRDGRHFYDVYQLLGDPIVLLMLRDRQQFHEVVENVAVITRREYDADAEVRPEGGFATCVAFDPGSETSKRLRDGYTSTMPELYFGRGPLPTWEAICDRVASFYELL